MDAQHRISNMEELEAVLEQLLIPDTVVIRQADATIKAFTKSKACIEPLVAVLQRGRSEGVRQYAATVLRQNMSRFWSHLPETGQKFVKNVLLERLANEQNLAVRGSICQLVGEIGLYEIPSGRWPELLPFLFSQMELAPDEGQRQSAVHLFYRLLDTMADCLRPLFPQLIQFFGRAMKDSSELVRAIAIESGTVIFANLESREEYEQFLELFDVILETTVNFVHQNREDYACLAIELLDDIVVQLFSVLVHRKKLVVIQELMLQILETVELDAQIRLKAIDFFIIIVQKKPKAVARKDVLHRLFAAIFSLMSLPETDIDDEEDVPYKAAARALDFLGFRLPTGPVFEQVLQFVHAYVNDASNPLKRRAAMHALTVLAEGSAESFRDHLDDLLPIVYRSMEDETGLVRTGAALALGQFGRHLQPEIADHHATVIPGLLSVLEHGTHDDQEGVCYALETFCESLEERILPYVHALADRLLFLLEAVDVPLDVKEVALSALGAVARAAKGIFDEFFERTMYLLVPFLEQTASEMLRLRAQATETIGNLVAAVPRRFEDGGLFDTVVELILRGMEMENIELREYSFSFCTTVVEILKDAFVRYLEPFARHLQDTLKREDLKFDMISGDEELEDPNETGLPSVDDDTDEEDETVMGKKTLRQELRTAHLEERFWALQAVGAIAEHCSAFLSEGYTYANVFIPLLMDAIDFPHPKIRKVAIDSLGQVLVSLGKTCRVEPSPSTQTLAGRPLSSPAEGVVHPNVAGFSSQLAQICLEILEGESDVDAVASALDALHTVVEVGGVEGFAPYTDKFAELCAGFLLEQGCCQEAENDPELEAALFGQGGGGLEDLMRADDIRLHMVDVVTDIAQLYGERFAPVFARICQTMGPKGILKQVEEADIMGFFAEVLSTLRSAAVEFIPHFVPVFLLGCQRADPVMRRNCAFGISACFELGPNEDSKALQLFPVLQVLGGYFNDEETPGSKDNAASAVAWILRRHRQFLSVDTMEKLLPFWINALPLKDDFGENPAVLGAVFDLWENARDLLNPFVPHLLRALISELETDHIPAEPADLRRRVAEFIRCGAAAPGFAENVALALSSTDREKLSRLMDS